MKLLSLLLILPFLIAYVVLGFASSLMFKLSLMLCFDQDMRAEAEKLEKAAAEGITEAFDKLDHE